MAKLLTTIKCTSVAAHFNGHESALEQYRRHCLMQHVHGYPGSHWMLPSGNNSLCIAPAAAGVTANKTKTKNVPQLLTVSMTMAMRRYDTAHIA
jgi:hypothetical protein